MNHRQELYIMHTAAHPEFYPNFERAALKLLRATPKSKWMVGVFIDVLRLSGTNIDTLDENGRVTSLHGPLMRELRYRNHHETRGRLRGRAIEEGRAESSGIDHATEARANVPASVIRKLVDAALLTTITTVPILKAELGIKFDQNYNAEVKVMMFEMDWRMEQHFATIPTKLLVTA